MKRMSETQMERWTREEVAEYAKKRWAERFRLANDGSMDGYTIEEYANIEISLIDEDGWDEDIHGDIDLAMEAWARGTFEGTPWE